ncbi:hypothetical protein CEXT_37521 [Caerostris extrusa]|uniref:Uncharacterized protein n=1 Tax=Caerostris extrusa TaxID=172846 RepID=A0AAV4WCZ4_CAEEX|nr:hypothetical protein CEXT_37521 [Caerostris extrusa]
MRISNHGIPSSDSLLSEDKYFALSVGGVDDAGLVDSDERVLCHADYRKLNHFIFSVIEAGSSNENALKMIQQGSGTANWTERTNSWHHYNAPEIIECDVYYTNPSIAKFDALN